MKTCVSYKRPAAFALAAAFFSTCLNAQTGELNPTVVTATRTAQAIGELVADVSVIDRAEIERSGAVGLSDLLMRLPGVEMVRNGGAGSVTSVYLRGAETRFTAVYIDGVRIDSQSTGGATWEGIPLAQIERVEVLRGPASAIYGSDAIGGVIQIFTRKGTGAFTPSISVGAGSNHSGRVQAGFSGAQQGVDYSVSVARETSQGFNSRPIAGQNPDKDGYQQSSVNARMGWQLNPDQRLEVSALSNDMTSRYDSGATNDARNLHRLQTAGLNWQARWSEHYSTKISVSDSDTRYETLPSPYLTQTQLRGYLWQNEFRHGPQLITATVERREDELENASTTPRSTARAQNGLALGYGWSGKQHTWQMHVRQDDDSEFGIKNTGSIGYGYALTPQWRLTASTATAFRAPTLFQRFSTSGVASLLPEYSRNVELGARYTQGSANWGVIVYRNQVDNLITYVPGPGACASTSGCYVNTAQAEYLGMTLSGQQMLGDVRVRASFDLQDPHDRMTDKKLARRAQRYLNLGAETRLSTWTVGSDLRLTSERYDTAANTTVLPGYALLSLHAQTRLSPDWSLLFKVDNATDSKYQLANTYATAGRTFFVTMKWEPSAPSAP
jgi:vitamin B12 transporter